MSTPSAHVQPVETLQYQGFSDKGQKIPTSQPQPAWAQHEANYTNPHHPQPVAQQHGAGTPAPYAAPGAAPAPTQQAVGAQHEANYTNPYHPQPVAQSTAPASYAAPGAVPAPTQQQAVGTNQHDNQRPTWSACGSLSFGCAMAVPFALFSGLLLGWCAFLLLISDSMRRKLRLCAFAVGVSVVSVIGNALLMVYYFRVFVY